MILLSRTIYLILIVILCISEVGKGLNCFSSLSYPRLFGDAQGDTEFNVFDMDINGNFAVGGFSYSSNIAQGGSYPNPFLVYYEVDGTERWYRNFDKNYNYIDTVAFSPDGNKLVFVISEPGENLMVVVDPSVTYTVVGSYSIRDSGNDRSLKTAPSSLLVTSTAIFMGIYGASNKDRFKVMRLDLNAAVVWQYQLKRGDRGQCLTLTDGDANDLYVGGWEQDGNGSNDDKFATVARILKNQGGNSRGYVEWIREEDQGKVNNFYYIRRIKLASLPQKKLIGCLEHTSTSTAPFGIIEVSLDATNSPSSIVTYKHQIANEVIHCQGLHIKDSSEFLAYLSLRNSQVQKLAKIISSTQTIQFQTLPITGGTMTDSFFVSETQSYYIGSVQSLTSYEVRSFAKNIAYLMTYDISQSCLIHTYTWSTAASMTSASLTFTTTSAPDDKHDNLSPSSATLSLQTQGANTINPVWCMPQRTITTPTFTDPVYYVNEPLATYNVPNFELDVQCDDLAWTFQYDYMNPLATPTFPGIISHSNLDYSVQTNTYTDVKTYQFSIIGTLPNLQTVTRLFNIIVDIDCDITVITQGTITSSQTYQITQGSPLTIGNTLGWSQNIPSPTCPLITFSLTNQADDSPADAIFYLSGSNILLNTNSYQKVGSYNLNLVGTLGNQNSKLPFTVHVQNPCDSATISTTSITAMTYFTTQTALSVTVSAFTQDSGISGCNTFTYFATYSNGGTLDGSVFTFNPSTRIFNVFTNDVAKISLYNIMVTGYIMDPDKTATTTFTVDIRDNCENVALTPSSDQSITYRVKDPTNLIQGFNFLEDLMTCGSFTYTLTNFDDTAFDTTIFTFDAAAPSISVQTVDVNQINTYELKVTATLGAWGSSFCKVTVNIERGCADSIVTPATIATQTYQVTDPNQSFTFNDFTSSVTACGAFTYQAFDFTSGNDDPLDNSFISFDPSTKQFDVQTSDPTYIGTYTLKMVGTLGAGPTTSTTFTLEIVNPCSTSVIVAPTVATKTYYLLGADADFVLPIFTQDLAHATCSQFTYVLENSDLSQLDSAIFTFDPATRNLHVSSTDINMIATYTLKYSAYLLQTSVTQSSTFDIQVVHVCTTVAITKASDQVVQYKVKDLSTDIINLSFTDSLNLCGPFTYTLTNLDNSPIDNLVFTFDQATPKISIQTDDIAKVKNYQLKLTGTLGSWGSSTTTITVQVTLSCIDTTITPSVISAQNYFVTDAAKAIVFTEWLSSVPNCGAFTYTATISASPLDSNYITLSSANKKFSVQTLDPQFINTYTVTLKGTLASGATKDYIFTLTIKNPCETSVISPPSIALKTYYLLGSDLVTTLPIFTQDHIHTTCYNFQYELVNTDGSPLDTTLFSFDPITRVLTVSSTDTGQIGIYTLKYVGYLLQKGLVQGSMTFQVEVKHVCNLVNIGAPSNQVVGYPVKDPILTIGSLSFSDDLTVCGPFTYSLSNDDGTAFDGSIFTFDANTPEIYVQTNLVSQIATYKLKVTATLGAWGSKTCLVTVQIVHGCPDTTIIPSPIAIQTYSVTDSNYLITFNEWTSTVTSCGAFTYTATINALALDSNYI